MPLTPTHTLNVYELQSTENIALYKTSLEDVGCDSAYYCYELLTSGASGQQQLHFFRYEAEDGSLLAVMPFALRPIILNDTDTGYFDVSSPWGYNGPYFKTGLSEALIADFWLMVDAWYLEHNVVAEFLRFNFFGNYKGYTGKAVHTLLNVKGDITNWETFWSNLKSNTRNQFRKAAKMGLEFEMWYGDIPEKKIADFYTVYIGTMDRRDAVDSFYHPLEYFVNFQKYNSKKCGVGLVYAEGKPISSEFFLIADQTMFSFLGGTDSDYFKLRPNEYLKINAVAWANKKGLHYYMIGGGLSDGTEDKLYQYKKKYFPMDDDIDFYTGRKVVMPKAYLALVQMASIDMDGDTALVHIDTGFFPKYRQRKQ
jgi:hypothetical protein